MQNGSTNNSGDTIFGKIIRKEIPATIVFENERILAFRDINPQAPVHILIIPKAAIPSLAACTPQHAQLLGEICSVAAELARKEGIAESGYRVVTNIGQQGGQSVPHLHFHLLGGRDLRWPPG
jgi:histidine triad (HIT) family protein